MSSPNDRSTPKATPTTIDVASPFASATAHHETQLSDPPTGQVRRDSFRELLPGSVVGEIYEIDARLGAGAMGEVYAARHVNLGKRVAIKVISQRLSEDDAAIERFAMEARTLAQIQHPAIVAVEHVGELADGRAYFVMEFLRGESLFDRLSRGRVPLAEALRILDQMARGLDAAHGEGVTHRDLKPENTFLVHLAGEDPTIKLLDFGLAKLAADRADVDRRAERTQSGVAIGTPMYMSPEQMRGPDVDHRTDIYALGCVAYELLLGVSPFPRAHTAPELYAAHLHESPPLPRSIWPEIPPQLDLALFAMLAKDPAHRPTLAQVRSVIAGVRSTPPPQHAKTEFVGPRAPKTRRLRIAVIALIGGIAIGAAVTSRSKSTPTPAAPTTEHVAAPVPQPLTATTNAPTPPDANDKTARVEAPAPSTARAPAPRAKRIVTAPAVPVDAGVDKTPDPPPRPNPPPPPAVDRNQTINPFKHKANL